MFSVARKTPIDQLSKAITDTLNEYAGKIGENLGRITEEMGKKGRQALRRESKVKLKVHTGKYSKGWKMQVEHGRMSIKVTIYNDHYSLPHLLEYSHDVKNRKDGPVIGQTAPHPHIEPIEKELVEAFEREVLSKL